MVLKDDQWGWHEAINAQATNYTKKIIAGWPDAHIAKTVRMPDSTSFILCGSIDLILSVRKPLSIVTNCEMFTTDSLGNPDERELRWTLPGANARARLEVITATMTV